jgi:hypothetical protein
VDWLRLVENSAGPLVGSFAGAAAALSSLWLKERLDRKRLIQEWFEQEYVWGAINPLIELLNRWTHMILHQDSQPSLSVEFSTLPNLELVRLSSLLKTDALERMFYVSSGIVNDIGRNIHDYERPLIDWPHIVGDIAFLRDIMVELQSELLTVMIHKKLDVTKLHKQRNVAAIRERLEKHVEVWKTTEPFRLRTEISGWLKESTEIHQLLNDLLAKSEITLEDATGLRDRFITCDEKLRSSGILHPGILTHIADQRRVIDILIGRIESRQSESAD